MSRPAETAWQPSKRLERGNAAEQILADIKEQILAGRLARGARLPTEKQLADSYGVSGATVREAMRSLSTMQLIDVRHGSGAYVTAEADQLVALSLQTVIQLERIDLAQVLGVLGVLNSYAAELAATHASEQQLLTLTQALDAVDHGRAEEVAGNLTLFLGTLAEASGNALLATLCRFLAGIQIGLAHEVTAGNVDHWRVVAGSLGAERRALLEALKARDPGAARTAALTYHSRALEVIRTVPRAGAVTIKDPVTPSFLASLLQQSLA